MEALKKQRGVIKGSMTKLLAYTRTNLDKANIDEIYVKISRTQQLMNEFTEVEKQIFCEDIAIESDLSDFEDNYYAVLAGLNANIRKRSLTTPITQLNNTSFNTSQLQRTEIRLPKIAIPTFDGNYMEWQSFYDIYTSTIHSKDDLTAAIKFQYLKGLVKGEPAALIRHFPITDANYNEAFQKLIQRYDRKHYTITTFIKTFMEHPAITQPTSTNIRKMADAFDEVIRGLKALGTNAESRDHWLIYIALTKVDSESRALWAQETAGTDSETFDKLLKFLNKRTVALETEKGFSQKLQSTRSTKLRTFTTTTFPVCSICNQGEHLIHQCEKFKTMSAEQRSTMIKTMSRCFNCLSKSHRGYDCKSKARCQKCHRKHHSLLHEAVLDYNSNQDDTNRVTTEVITPKDQSAKSTTCANTSVNVARTILPTAIINIRDRHGEFHIIRALLDSASESSFISESCVQHLNLDRHHGRLLIKGIGESTVGQTRGTSELWIAPTRDTQPEWKVDAYIVSKIVTKRTGCSNTFDDNVILSDIPLADPTFNEPGTIDVLLGVDIFAKAMQGETRALSSGLIAMKTIFGWVIAGTSKVSDQPETANFNILIDIDRSLRQFWEVEEIPSPHSQSTEEEACEKLYTTTTTKSEDNKFNVRLPFRERSGTVGSSFHVAMSRLYFVERKFRVNNDFKDMYKQFMREYIELGHMSKIKGPVSQGIYYLPHHGVLRESSSTTKLRVVFDGSAKATNGVSLNDVLMVGPTIQDSLTQILIRFRQHKFVLTGDIEKMYRQVWMSEDDRRHQNILWRDDPRMPVQRYQLNTLTYGIASAPFLAIRSIQQVGIMNLKTSPSAARTIMRDFYVDDLMTGAETNQELLMLMKSVINLLSNHGFNLRKLRSNSSSLQSFIEVNQSNTVKSISSYPTSIKVLGLSWEPNHDTFKFSCQLSDCKVHSKRTLLSEASKIFDPLGWISPLTVKVKILFQNLWLQDLLWDDELPNYIRQSWSAIREDLINIDKITVPRWLGTTKQVALHGFSDASEKAYAAVVYAVTKDEYDSKSVLIASKTRVAPLKQKSLPRLELMGALLLSQLMKMIETSQIELTVNEKILWTDSKIVLDWLSAQPRRWSTFIANRTSEILDTHPNGKWQHVPSKENPSDMATRGVSLSELVQNKLWWNGPVWLTNKNSWPKQYPKKDYHELTTEEMRSINTMHTVVEKTWFDEFIARFSSYYKMAKILAMIIRFTNNLRSNLWRKSGNITRCEVSAAEQIIVKYVQSKELSEDITHISKGNQLPCRSKLKNLNPFLDNEGILRIGGRIQKSSAPFSVKHPIILSNQGHLPKTIAYDLHQLYHHAGIGFLINTIRRRYWILRVRQLAKQTVHKCIACFRQNPKKESQIMGNLPEARVVYSHPFDKVGVDYCGPFKVHTTRRRGQVPSKAYVCIFICLSTKAVHIEVAMSLSTESFIGALKRFIARRGLCSAIYSGNGSNFLGANNELKELYEFLKQKFNDISSFLLKSKIDWHFNPPAASHMGGIWEAAVKVAKACLKKRLGETIPTLEEFSTLMSQIEAVMNSRPICSQSNEEIDALTPAHFLIGRPLTDIPDADFTYKNPTPTARWHLIKQLQLHFWKRWQREYLTMLQTRQKWYNLRNNVTVGDLVLSVDDNLPPTRWALGKIIDLHPGHDGKVRVVTLKLGNTGNIIRRSIHKICKLPDDNINSIESTDSRGPECSRITDDDVKT